MGAGKTATGKALARLMQMEFLDLDEAIEAETHLSINEIFQKKGEPFFRAEEKRLLERIAAGSGTVVATGGGIVLNPANAAEMRRTGRVIYLVGSYETLWERVREKKDRPLLAVADPQTTFLKLFQERRPLYETCCHESVETDGLSPEDTAEKIMKESKLK